MILPSARNPKILNSNTDDAPALVREVADTSWVERATLLKEDERTSVYSGESSVGPVIVKTMRVDRLKDIASRALGSTRLRRQWDGWALLERAGVPTPACLALARDGSVETLVMRRSEGRTLLEIIAYERAPARVRSRLAASLGAALRLMDDAQIFNRDNKPSNIIVDPSLERVSVIDTAGVRVDQDPTLIYRMLASLVIEPSGVGAPVPLTDRMRLLRAYYEAESDAPKHRARWRLTRANAWEHVRDIVEAHGDPTPKDNPLA